LVIIDKSGMLVFTRAGMVPGFVANIVRLIVICEKVKGKIIT
jgi:hypothetical protein